jgi:hypothetical protein
MKDVVSTLFRVMNFPHNGRIFTIDQALYDNHNPSLTSTQFYPSYVPSFRVYSSPPHVNYIEFYTRCPIAPEKEYL